MAKRENFTAERIAGFKCPHGKQQVIYWDAKAPGLGLRITASGAKSYIFESKLHGKTLRLTIGDVQTFQIDGPAGKEDTARAQANRLKFLISQGIDPRQQKAEQKALAETQRAEAKKLEVTVDEAWHKYLAAPHKKPWSKRHLQNHIALAKSGGEKRTRGRRPGENDVTVPGPIYPLLSLRLAELDSTVVNEWLLNEVQKGPTQAEDAYRKLRTFVTWCSKRKEYDGIVQADACTVDEVRAAVPKVKAKSDCLQKEQLPGWFSAVRKIENAVNSAYLQTLLLTGARRGELAPLKWDEVDFKWKSMTIHDKMNGERVIPLTPYVEALLLDLKRRNDTPPNTTTLKKMETIGERWRPSKYVFSSKTSASGYIAEPRSAHQRALKVAGINVLTIHGLRRSFGTLCEWVEVPTGISAQIMGHAPSAIAEKHYRIRPLDMLRMWHEKIEAWMLEQAGIELKQPEANAEKPTLIAVK